MISLLSSLVIFFLCVLLCSLATFSYNVTICTLNCGETKKIILSYNHKRLHVPKRAFISCTPTNVRHAWVWNERTIAQVLVKATSELHCRDAGGRQWHAQKESWMDSAAKKDHRCTQKPVYCTRYAFEMVKRTLWTNNMKQWNLMCCMSHESLIWPQTWVKMCSFISLTHFQT